MALTNDALTTYEKVKSALGLADDSKQEQLEDIINAVGEEMAAIAGRKFYRTTWTETYVGSGDVFLFTRQTPIVSVSQIRTIDIEGNTIETVASNSYRIHDADAGEIYRSLGFTQFARAGDGITAGPVDGMSPAKFEVTYVGGWYTPKQYDDDNTQICNLPFDLQRAALMGVLHVYNAEVKTATGGNPNTYIVSETSMGGSSVTYGQNSPSTSSSQATLNVNSALLPATAAAVAYRYNRNFVR